MREFEFNNCTIGDIVDNSINITNNFNVKICMRKLGEKI
jgi:hypothetical protein